MDQLTAVDHPLLEVNYPMAENLIAPLHGRIEMSDIHYIESDLNDQLTGCLNNDAFNYGLGFIAARQPSSQKDITMVFPLNFCGFGGVYTNDCDFEEDLNEFFKNNVPGDIFAKHYLVFPVIHRGTYFCVLIVNPQAVISTKTTHPDRQPKMIIFGHWHIFNFTSRAEHWGIKILEYFAHLLEPEQNRLANMHEVFSIEKVYTCRLEKTWGSCGGVHCWIMAEKLMKYLPKKEESYMLTKRIKLIKKHGESEETMLADMKRIKNDINNDIRDKILEGTDSVAKKLYNQRMEIFEYQKQEKNRKRKMSADTENPAAKRWGPIRNWFSS